MSLDRSKQTPAISVIIPAYNAASCIKAAVQSVIGQTFSDFELLVIDDGSTDDLAGALSSVEDRRLTILTHEQNRGAAAARNTGIANARGEYIAFLDSDDIWLPNKLARQYDFMINSGDRLVKASCTSFIMCRENGRRQERILSPDKDWNDILLGGCTVSPGSTLMAEASLFDRRKIGPLSVALRRLEDWDWLLTYIQAFRLGVVEEILAEVRVSGYPKYETVSRSARQLRLKQLKILENHFGKNKGKMFLAGLEIENATAAYRQKKFLTTIKHMCLAGIASPLRAKILILRIFEKIKMADYS